MQLPQYKKKKRDKLKICQEPGCGKEFWGHPICKYCELHRDIRFRKRKRRVQTNPSDTNKILVHNFSNVTDIELPCELPGCRKKYMTKLFPKQNVYPKYCEDHRSEFRRNQFLRKQRLAV